MTENNRIEYKRELNDGLEKEVLKGENYDCNSIKSDTRK